ncbi:glycosyltransferase family 2 protein [Nonomuraea sp. NBC_01738]|uniref:glycosyltransferase family 2 protein n=1 Tax=Nonomuraea sp. NBC_01738 TaxID=2976003 RepID=UPI002E156EF5|nr:glycosyltransferase family 2 protein [Nonomuraea sp. NBC_01738]
MTTGLTVLVPCFNEGAQVEVAHRELCAALDGIVDLEILFVDDGSRDDSLARIKALAAADPRVRYVSFTRNFGIDAVMAAGFRYASNPWTVQCDADLQVPPSEIATLLAKAAEGYDVVFGRRRHRRDPLVRRIGSAGLHWMARSVFRIDMPRGASTFRLVNTEVARTISDLRLPWFIPAVPMVGARHTAVDVMHRERTAGRSKLRLGRLAGHSFELFFGFSWRPLNAVYLLAALLLPLALIFDSSRLHLAVSAVTLAAVALLSRYVHGLARRLPSFYVREANVEVRPGDLLAPPAPVPVMPRGPAVGATDQRPGH